MKCLQGRIAITVLSFTLFGAAGCQETVRIAVQDESGDPVVDAAVDVHFTQRIEPGWGWGSGGAKTVSGSTDERGRVTLRGSSSAGDAVFGAEKNGYYRSSGKVVFGRSVEEDEQQEDDRDNRFVNLVLRPIGGPVPMYAKRVNTVIPVEDEAVGFDLTAGDWVAPHGNGSESDMLITLSRKTERVVRGGIRNRERTLYDVQLTVQFPGEGAGIRRIAEDRLFPDSAFVWPRTAPSGGYEDSLVKYRRRTEDGTEYNIEREVYYFIKVRSIYDEDGELESALYGKITGDFRFKNLRSMGNEITFTYYLNPEPNSRNMEFDPERNLFEDLDDREDVNEP